MLTYKTIIQKYLLQGCWLGFLQRGQNPTKSKKGSLNFFDYKNSTTEAVNRRRFYKRPIWACRRGRPEERPHEELIGPKSVKKKGITSKAKPCVQRT